MIELFASGRIVDGIIVLMLLEIGMLVFLQKRGLLHIAMIPFVINSAAGAALLFSLRAALLHEAWPSISVWLCIALIAHVSDLWMRCRR